MNSFIIFLKTWAVGLLSLLILQFLVFLYGYSKKRLDIIDVFWGLSFIVVGLVYAVMNIDNLNIATSVAFMCITVWGLRLSSHIFVRFKSNRTQDKRYTDLANSFINKPILVYIKVFAFQALLASLIMLVYLAGMLSSRQHLVLIIAGSILWLFGFAFESVADSQLKKHIANKSGGLIKTGLWKYSRHPNYFGEIVQWWAVWLMLAGGEFAAIGLIGPVIISVFIIFISGIPMLEKRMSNKEGWTEYKKSTSIIIPR